MQLIEKDICGSWESHPARLKDGWFYPCYNCHVLTSHNVVYHGYTLWGCKDCLPKLTEECVKTVLTCARLTGPSSNLGLSLRIGDMSWVWLILSYFNRICILTHPLFSLSIEIAISKTKQKRPLSIL